MLILSRTAGKAVMIGDEIILQVLAVDDHQGHVKLGIEAPKSLMVRRQELHSRVHHSTSKVVITYKRRARAWGSDDA
ncbi:carbon storage regulator [Pseudomonas sp. RT6P73]